MAGWQGQMQPEGPVRATRVSTNGWATALETYSGQEVQCKETTGVLRVVGGDARVDCQVGSEFRLRLV